MNVVSAMGHGRSLYFTRFFLRGYGDPNRPTVSIAITSRDPNPNPNPTLCQRRMMRQPRHTCKPSHRECMSCGLSVLDGALCCLGQRRLILPLLHGPAAALLHQRRCSISGAAPSAALLHQSPQSPQSPQRCERAVSPRAGRVGRAGSWSEHGRTGSHPVSAY